MNTEYELRHRGKKRNRKLVPSATNCASCGTQHGPFFMDYDYDTKAEREPICDRCGKFLDSVGDSNWLIDRMIRYSKGETLD